MILLQTFLNDDWRSFYIFRRIDALNRRIYKDINGNRGNEMGFLNELYYFYDLDFMGIILEILLVTSCISTIIFILTKNQYYSYLSAAPLCYIFSFFSSIGHGIVPFLLLVLSMTIQAGIILLINHQSKKQFLLNAPKDNDN